MSDICRLNSLPNVFCKHQPQGQRYLIRCVNSSQLQWKPHNPASLGSLVVTQNLCCHCGIVCPRPAPVYINRKRRGQGNSREAHIWSWYLTLPLWSHDLLPSLLFHVPPLSGSYQLNIWPLSPISISLDRAGQYKWLGLCHDSQNSVSRLYCYLEKSFLSGIVNKSRLIFSIARNRKL